MCLHAVYPSNFIADEPRRAEEQALRERRRLTDTEPAPYESLPAYTVALCIEMFLYWEFSLETF